MVARFGERLIYDNFGMGCAKHPEENDKVYLTFTDHDNDEIHMFAVQSTQIEQYFNLVKQTVAGQKIQVAGAHEMPKGKPNGS